MDQQTGAGQAGQGDLLKSEEHLTLLILHYLCNTINSSGRSEGRSPTTTTNRFKAGGNATIDEELYAITRIPCAPMCATQNPSGYNSVDVTSVKREQGVTAL